MLTLIKLGGSLVTDKTTSKSFRKDVTARVAKEIKHILDSRPMEQFIIGHGSGSYGHVEAKKHNTINGVTTETDWLGFCKVGQVASELNQLVIREFIAQDIPVMHLHPSSSVVSDGGVITSMDIGTIKNALKNQLIPLVHGDIAFDKRIGGTIISTETIFIYLLKHFDIKRIILLGEVDGVLDSNNSVIKHVTPSSLHIIENSLGAANGVDVTGGMYRKVKDMVDLVTHHPKLEVVIANGNSDKILTNIISNNAYIGTRITADL